MLIKTIFNHVSRFKSFVVKKVKIISEELEIRLEARKNSNPICSGCGIAGTTYDRRPERRYEFIPFWGIKTFLVYAPRRVDCFGCGVRVESVPWCEGKHRMTIVLRQFLAHWAKKISWQDVAREFKTTWQNVFRSVSWVVEYGLSKRDLSNITAIGVDEIHWSTRKGFLTIVYQIDAHSKRLLWIAKGRTVKGILGFFRMLGKEKAAALQFICSDMWKAYIKVIKNNESVMRTV